MGIIRVFYAQGLFNLMSPILRPEFKAPEIRFQTRSINYREMPYEEFNKYMQFRVVLIIRHKFSFEPKIGCYSLLQKYKRRL